MIQLSTPSEYDCPSSAKMKVHNTPTDMNVIAYHPPLEIFHVSVLGQIRAKRTFSKVEKPLWRAVAPDGTWNLGCKDTNKKPNRQAIRIFFQKKVNLEYLGHLFNKVSQQCDLFRNGRMNLSPDTSSGFWHYRCHAAWRCFSHVSGAHARG